MGTVIAEKKINNNEIISEFAFEKIIDNVIKIPGIKVDRTSFLKECLENETSNINNVIEIGPIEAGFSKEKLHKIAQKLIIDVTSKASLTSIAMNIPKKLMDDLPQDTLQFYGITVKLAQELTYLYGVKDMWENSEDSDNNIRNHLILYCGTMFGASKAMAGVRLLSSKLGVKAGKNLSQLISNTTLFSCVKKISKLFGVKITKKTIENGTKNVVETIGGFIVGALTYITMKSMADKLLKTLEEANFHYNDEKIKEDISEINSYCESEESESVSKVEKKSNIFTNMKNKISNIFKKKDN